MAILDRKVKASRSIVIYLVKVHWWHRKTSEWTWEPEAEIRKHYPDMFTSEDFLGEV